MFGVDGIEPTWLTDGRAAAVWDFAAEYNLVIVPTVFANEFKHICALAQHAPTASVAIDHCGFTDMVEGDGQAMLFALADIPSLHLKVTSYVLEAAERDDGDAAILIERLAGAFGADRAGAQTIRKINAMTTQANLHSRATPRARSTTRHETRSSTQPQAGCFLLKKIDQPNSLRTARTTSE